MKFIFETSAFRLVREIERVHERWSTEAKTLCEEMLTEVEKKHSIWEAEVTTLLEHLISFFFVY